MGHYVADMGEGREGQGLCPSTKDSHFTLRSLQGRGLKELCNSLCSEPGKNKLPASNGAGKESVPVDGLG